MLNFALSIVSGIFVGAYVARFLGPDGLGVLAIFASLVWFSNTTNDLGTNQYIVKSYSSEETSDNEMFWSLLLLIRVPLAILSLIVCYLLLYFGIFSESLELSPWVVTVGLLGVLLSPVSQFKQLVVANVRNGELANYGVLVLVLSTVLRVGSVLLGLDLVAFIIVQTAISFLYAVSLSIVVFKNKLVPSFSPLKWKKSIEVTKNYLPLALSATASGLYSRLDIFMLSAMLSPAAVGIYSVTTRLMSILTQISGSMIQTYKSSIFNGLKKHTEIESKNTFLEDTFRLFTSTSMAASLAGVAVSFVLIPLLYGEDFSEASWALLVRAISIPLVAQGSIRLCYLIDRDETKLSLQSSLLGLGINIAVNLMLIPYWGIIGAAVATAVSQVVRMLFASYIFGEKNLFFIQLKAFVPRKNSFRVFKELSSLSK